MKGYVCVCILCISYDAANLERSALTPHLHEKYDIIVSFELSSDHVNISITASNLIVSFRNYIW